MDKENKSSALRLIRKFKVEKLETPKKELLASIKIMNIGWLSPTDSLHTFLDKYLLNLLEYN